MSRDAPRDHLEQHTHMHVGDTLAAGGESPGRPTPPRSSGPSWWHPLPFVLGMGGGGVTGGGAAYALRQPPEIVYRIAVVEEATRSDGQRIRALEDEFARIDERLKSIDEATHEVRDELKLSHRR